MKRFMGIIVGILLFTLISSAHAYVNCNKVTLTRTGFAPSFATAGSAGHRVGLINNTGAACGEWPAGEERYFWLTTDVGNTGMAIALTSTSTDRTMYVRIGGNAEVNSLITIIYVNQPETP